MNFLKINKNGNYVTKICNLYCDISCIYYYVHHLVFQAHNKHHGG